MTSTGNHQQRGSLLVVALCFVTVVFDGYDLIVYGATVPSLLSYQEWGMTAIEAGVIGSFALAGMLVGALLSGVITDVLGRRRMMLVSVTWFSLFMGCCALAPTLELFGLCRLLAGIGLGGVLPTAVALTVEFAPPTRRNFYNAVMNSGYSVGAIIASVLAIALLEPFGFRTMYLIGAVPLLTVVPLGWWWLPESPAYLMSKGRSDEAVRIAQRFGLPDPTIPGESAGAQPARDGRTALRQMFRPPHLRLLLAFSVACLIGQLLTYGLNTWLPEIMRGAGYPLGSALQFLLALSIGAILGALVLSALADRVGGKPVTIAGFVIAVVSLLLMSANPPTAVLYLAVALAGVGANGTMVVLNGYSATRFPAEIRASALGTMMGLGKFGGVLGPLVGGWVMAAGLGMAWSFYVFIVPAAIGVIAMLFDRTHTRRASPVEGSAGDREGELSTEAR